MFKLLKLLTRRYPEDARVYALREALGVAPESGAARPLARVAVQCVEDPFYFGLFALIAKELRRSAFIESELVMVRSVNAAVGFNWRTAIMRSPLVSAVLNVQWKRAFAGLVDRIAYCSQSLRHPIADLVDWWNSVRLWLGARDEAALFGLAIQGVPVGDLIADTYLRFRPSPRFKRADLFTIRLIWQAHRDVRLARRYFGGRKPTLYLTSNCCYLQHGIPVRVALQEGVWVYAFGNEQEFGKLLTKADSFHAASCDRYKEIFETLDHQAERLAQAEKELEERLNGGQDAAFRYLPTRAYAALEAEAPREIKGGVVIFLHDFYDSPHYLPGLFFRDFWEWACVTIEELLRAGVRCYVKPHPDQIDLSDDAVRQLRKAFPEISFLSSTIANSKLAQAGMICGVTAYGKVAHELAYLGIPTICCAKHPHHAFQFSRTATTLDQYKEFLHTPSVLPIDRSEMQRQALAFYYMHNLYGTADQLALREASNEFMKACERPDCSEDELARLLRALPGLPAFTAFMERLRSHCMTSS